MFKKKTKLKKGDHLKVHRSVYTHHGIYIGDGIVIHFGGADKDIENATICKINIIDFANGDEVFLVQNASNPEETIRRAEECLNQKGYDLFDNNCEHFANYCISGKKYSRQVDSAFEETFRNLVEGEF